MSAPTRTEKVVTTNTTTDLPPLDDSEPGDVVVEALPPSEQSPDVEQFLGDTTPGRRFSINIRSRETGRLAYVAVLPLPNSVRSIENVLEAKKIYAGAEPLMVVLTKTESVDGKRPARVETEPPFELELFTGPAGVAAAPVAPAPPAAVAAASTTWTASDWIKLVTAGAPLIAGAFTAYNQRPGAGDLARQLNEAQNAGMTQMQTVLTMVQNSLGQATGETAAAVGVELVKQGPDLIAAVGEQFQLTRQQYWEKQHAEQQRIAAAQQHQQATPPAPIVAPASVPGFNPPPAPAAQPAAQPAAPAPVAAAAEPDGGSWPPGNGSQPNGQDPNAAFFDRIESAAAVDVSRGANSDEAPTAAAASESEGS